MAGPGPDPSTGPSGRSWGLVLLTVVVVAALGAPVVVAAVARLSNGGGSSSSAPPVTSTSAPPSSGPAPTAKPSPTPTPTPTPKPTTKPTSKPSATQTPTAPSSSQPPSPGGATCWDGSQSPSVDQCSEPQGEAGLRYVFPSAGYERCRSASPSDQTGLLLRLLCQAKLADGTAVVIGYAEWESVTAGATYFENQDMERAEITDATGHVAVYQYLGQAGPEEKVAGLFARDPFSVTLELPMHADVQSALAQVVSARPADQVRGQPNP